MKGVTIAAAAVVLGACHGEAGYAPGSDDAGIAPDGGGSHNCEAWCATRAPKEENDGFCPVEGLGDEDGDCVPACRALAQSEPLGPLRECIEEEALCFTSTEQCIEGKERLAHCTAWCAYRATEREGEGFCEPSLQDFPDQGCTAVCVRALHEGLPPGGVEQCIRDNALCFIDLGACTGT